EDSSDLRRRGSTELPTPQRLWRAFRKHFLLGDLLFFYSRQGLLRRLNKLRRYRYRGGRIGSFVNALWLAELHFPATCGALQLKRIFIWFYIQPNAGNCVPAVAAVIKAKADLVLQPAPLKRNKPFRCRDLK